MKSNAMSVNLKITGRNGELSYQDESRSTSVYVEIASVPNYDLLVSTDQLSYWTNGKAITIDEKNTILKSFDLWAKNENIKCQW